jgi:hypothetical protein
VNKASRDRGRIQSESEVEGIPGMAKWNRRICAKDFGTLIETNGEVRLPVWNQNRA